MGISKAVYRISGMKYWNGHTFVYRAGRSNILLARPCSVILIIIIKQLASLAKPASKVKILVRPWPDLPGWFPQPWYIPD